MESQLTVRVSQADIVPAESRNDGNTEQHQDVVDDGDEDLALDGPSVNDLELGEHTQGNCLRAARRGEGVFQTNMDNVKNNKMRT